MHRGRGRRRPARADRGRSAGHRRHGRGGSAHGGGVGGVVAGLGFVVELTFLDGREKTRRLRRLLAAAVRQMSATRRARVRALAKINLDLRVLDKRPDGFHELRTIFQTISLADTLEIAFTPARRTAIALEDELQIPDNLVVRAARLTMDAMRATGTSRDAPRSSGFRWAPGWAAVRATPRRSCSLFPCWQAGSPALPKLSHIGEELGSDVPFFLLGGTAVGIGRGTELFPLPDMRAQHGLVVAPGIHVNTAQAYRDLSPRLTTELQQNKIFSFQSLTWDPGSLARGSSPLSPAPQRFRSSSVRAASETGYSQKAIGACGRAAQP